MQSLRHEESNPGPRPLQALFAHVPEWAVVGAVFLFIGLFQWMFQIRGCGYTEDSLNYLEGAQSFAKGGGYRLKSFEGNLPISVYPPAQSAYLSLFWRLGGEFPGNVPALNFGMILIGLLAQLGAYRLWRAMGVPVSVACLMLAGWGMSVMWCQYVYMLMSDFGLTAITSWLAFYWSRKEGDWSNTTTWLICGLAMALGIWWRSATIGFVAGLGLAALTFVRRGNWRPVIAFSIPCLIAIILWRMMSARGTDYSAVWSSRWEDFGGWPAYFRQFRANLLVGLGLGPFWDMIFPSFGRVHFVISRHNEMLGLIVRVFCALVGWLALGAGAMAAWRHRASWGRPAALVLLPYVALVVAWPVFAWIWHRFFFPILPLLLGWIWLGCRQLWGSRSPIWGARLAACILIGIIATNLPFTVNMTRYWTREYRLDELKEVADWAAANTPKESRVASSVCLPATHFSTWLGRPLVLDYLYYHEEAAVPTPLTHEAQGMIPAQYVLVRELGLKETAPTNFFTTVKTSSAGTYRLLAVNPTMEEAYRRQLYPGKLPK